MKSTPKHPDSNRRNGHLWNKKNWRCAVWLSRHRLEVKKKKKIPKSVVAVVETDDCLSFPFLVGTDKRN